jgi:hypothetical protein
MSLHEWLTSKPSLDAITSYKINGEELFFPPWRGSHTLILFQAVPAKSPVQMK